MIYYRERTPSQVYDSDKEVYRLKFWDSYENVIREYLVFRFALDTFFEKIFDHREILQSVERIDWDRAENLEDNMTKIEDPEKFSKERGLGPIEKNLKHIEEMSGGE